MGTFAQVQEFAIQRRFFLSTSSTRSTVVARSDILKQVGDLDSYIPIYLPLGRGVFRLNRPPYTHILSIPIYCMNRLILA